ncbi:MAG: Unknown protein [uncultured Thiotrichaceae bacterium]|uniref:SoxXA-binding protein SoxK n=1 Tax=uncultured Thiotrichaceae bacterium TaxID=298394 RepID=A0A6S6T0I2_9GAMM|nr:MAG: Unknown protein [uncultured Thiotrichaceae bacterium]
MKTLLASLLVAFSVSAAHAADDLATVLAEAKAENKKAAEVGFEWRDTGKFIKKAEEEKDAEKAMKLAKKALNQAKMAQVQAEAAKNAGPTF